MERTNTITSLLLVACLSGASLTAASKAVAQETTSLELTVSGMEQHEGALRIALFHGEENYNTSNPIMGTLAMVDGDVATVTFSSVVEGEYGIKLFHDVNNNDEMDTNVFGIPKEPFAFSNNAPARFGPAVWDDAKFEITAEKNTHSISFQ